MPNLRTQDRHLLNVYLEVLDASNGERLGRVVDLTIDGLRLVSCHPVAKDRVYQLVIDTDIGGTSREPIQIEGRCTWAGRDINPDLHASGFSFPRVSARQKALLARLVRHFGFDRNC